MVMRPPPGIASRAFTARFRSEFSSWLVSIAHNVIRQRFRQAQARPSEVVLDTDVPVLSVVLTPQHFHEHETHHQFFHAHLVQFAGESFRLRQSLKRQEQEHRRG